MKILLWLLAAALLWGGGQSTWTALTNSAPAQLSCAAFAEARPDADWLSLSGCKLDIDEMAYTGEDVATELFVPVRAVDAATDAPLQMVLASTDAGFLKIFSDLETVDEADAPALAALLERLVAARNPATLSGLLQYGIELDDDARDQILALIPGLSDDFVMLAHNEQPELVPAMLLLGIGLALLVFLLWPRRRDDPDDDPDGAPAQS